MDLLYWVILGFAVGLLGRLIMPGRDPVGGIATILLGIAGALLAGSLGRVVGWYGPGERAGFVAATLGALVLLAAYRVLRRG